MHSALPSAQTLPHKQGRSEPGPAVQAQLAARPTGFLLLDAPLMAVRLQAPRTQPFLALPLQQAQPESAAHRLLLR